LVIVGERDLVTPRPIAEPLARQIPGVELFVVRGATHFVLLEFPELVNLRVEKFLREQGADLSHT
jgi:pimeloyl-ACP methyl ester carboxylesterase